MTHPLLEFLTAQLVAVELDSDEIHNFYDCDKVQGYGCDCPVPAAVLATVAAFRAILALHVPATHQAIRYGRPHGEPHQYCVTCIGGTPCECCPVDHPDNQWPCGTVRALVSAFASRDGYLPEWAPT